MNRIAIAILAAGRGSRMNSQKQLALFQGETLLARAVRIAHDSAVGDVNVVLGYRADELAAHVGLDASIVFNDEWEEGVASSIRAAVKELKAANYNGVLFTTVDQPFVDKDHLRILADVFNSGAPQVVASRYGDPVTEGIPAIFPKVSFDKLLELHGDKGAKQIIASSNATYVDAPMASFDIDTPKDLEECRAEAEKVFTQSLSVTISSEINNSLISNQAQS